MDDEHVTPIDSVANKNQNAGFATSFGETRHEDKERFDESLSYIRFTEIGCHTIMKAVRDGCGFNRTAAI
jgi:hypothetical protein